MTISEAIQKLTHAKNWSLDADFIKALEMSIKALEAKSPSEIVHIGTKVRVTKKLYGHEFKIGEEVFISDYYEDDSIYTYKCVNANDYWFLYREEFEPV